MAEEEFLIKHEGNQYDIAHFLKNHPGGFNYVEGFQNKDIASKMTNSEHSKSAFYLLREYKLGGRDEKNVQGDEDLEKLVDWNEPMLNQVAGLGSRYNEWVTCPVDRKLRLFGNPILESLTITPWYVVPIVWIPIVTYLIYCGSLQYSEVTKDPSPILPSVLYICLGIIIWTLLEYSLHRWVFHMEPSGNSKILIYIHFGIHGLHHKVPFDARRLVFPPVPAAVLAYGGYHLIKALFPPQMVLLITAGGILGYVIYDMIHFYLHNGSPKEGTYFYTMKRYHNQHHFVHHNSGFGISNLYWDKVFGTAISLKKLAVGIRWCSNKFKLS
ncbi:hypothetical protein ILUMI_00847 [Ignelater luminosus]|uniref:Fatty acid 2-hydroxylase n=1 Tax=Ignelater luminosus TaxID=2038154 RepID=A0A8K0DRU9_IGNLU|nr:hypothetical protein ILUMI_00847 [Ignelater luminosus]